MAVYHGHGKKPYKILRRKRRKAVLTNIFSKEKMFKKLNHENTMCPKKIPNVYYALRFLHDLVRSKFADKYSHFESLSP